MEIFFIIAPVPNTLPAQASPGIRQISPPPPANPPPLPIREYALLLYMQTQQKKQMFRIREIPLKLYWV